MLTARMAEARCSGEPFSPARFALPCAGLIVAATLALSAEPAAVNRAVDAGSGAGGAAVSEAPEESRSAQLLRTRTKRSNPLTAG